MKITKSELRNIILNETKKVLNEISNDLLANAAKSAKDKGRRVQEAIFFEHMTDNLNEKYEIEDVLHFYNKETGITAYVYYDGDLDEKFVTFFENGGLILSDTYYDKDYTIKQFEQEFAGDFPTPIRRKIMAGLHALENILKKYNADESAVTNNYDDISDDEIRVIKAK